LTATSTSLQLSLANVGNLHSLKVGPELLDLTKLATPPGIAAGAAMSQPVMGEVFAIGHAGKFKTESFNTFSAFMTQLAADLAGANMPTVEAVVASGQYDTGKNVLAAQRLAVLLSN